MAIPFRVNSRATSCAAAALTMAACASNIDSVDAVDDPIAQALVSNKPSELPPRGPALPAGHEIPGVLNDLSVATFSALDAIGQPAPTGDLQGWANRVADPSLAAPAMASALQGAINAIDKDTVGDKIVKGAAEYPVKTLNVAYEPERARWKASDQFPFAADEFRQRGARLYCAAKSAYEQGPGKTVLMGKKSLATFNFLGFPVDLMGIQPSMALGAPQKFLTNANDGAQAFSIPIKVGTKFTPISFLPFLTHDQEQVVYLTTADGAVVNDIGGTSVVTATHADAFTGFTGGASNSWTTPLFAFPFGTIDLSLSYTWGQAACSQADTFTNCGSSPLQKVRRVLTSDASGYPGQRFGGATMQPYQDANGNTVWDGILNDGPWALSFNNDYPIFQINGFEALISPLSVGDPMMVRALQNNDKSLEVQTAIGLSASIGATLGASFGPFMIGARVSGGITSNLATIHRIREQINGIEQTRWPETNEFPYQTAYPETDLSITPDLRADLGVDMSLTLLLKVDLGLLNLSLERKLLSTGTSTSLTPQAEGSSGWPDYNRARLATAVSWDGTITTDNSLVSHWPRTQLITAQPDSVDQCLAAPSPTRLPGIFPPPCANPPAPAGGAPRFVANLCFVAPPPAPDESVCYGRRAAFAQSGNWHMQDFDGKGRAVRVLDETAANELKQVMMQCAADNPNEDYLKSMFNDNIMICDANGRAFEPDKVIQQVQSDPAAIQEPDACN